MKKTFQINYHFISFAHLSLGFHIDFSNPNIELHLPFGFLRIGMIKAPNKKLFKFSSAKNSKKLIVEELRTRGYEVIND